MEDREQSVLLEMVQQVLGTGKDFGKVFDGMLTSCHWVCIGHLGEG